MHGEQQRSTRSKRSQEDQHQASHVPATSKKRKLNRDPANKYVCPEQGCGKCYSRAEHLKRHQLNHAPQQIYHCDFDGCERYFVRQDLCARHRERHVKANSNLLRKDSSRAKKEIVASSSSSLVSERAQSPPTRTLRCDSRQSPLPSISDDPDNHISKSTVDSEYTKDDVQAGFASTRLGPQMAPSQSISQVPQHLEDHHQPKHDHTGSNLGSTSVLVERTSLPFGSVQTSPLVTADHDMQPPPFGHDVGTARFVRLQATSMPMVGSNNLSGLVNSHSVQNLEPVYSVSNMNSTGYLQPLYGHPSTHQTPASTNTGSTPAIPPFALQIMGIPHAGASRSDSVTSFVTKNPCGTFRNDPFDEAAMVDRIPAAMTMPVFSHEATHHLSVGDELMGWLFDDEQHHLLHSPSANLSSYPFVRGSSNPQQDLHAPFQHQMQPLPNLPTIPSIVDSGQPESVLSPSRRQRLLKLVEDSFRNERHALVTQNRQKVFEGDRDEDSHVLSLRMLQIYISSFWLHIHSQMPIMHRPTFSAETCPDLLLIAIMALGASCLEKSHGYEVTQASAELSFFLAWHARHLIYEDPDFLPPAKLWVFQALLFLEIFEKMYSTRSLHERAHVHHATTLALMRRGSSLMGRSAVDFQFDNDDPTRTPPGPNGSINTSGKNTSDAWWNQWISNEATRRAAFAAFIIDTTHATMFGHSAVMVAHEVRMPLPCDEALWSAKSGSEVKRMEQDLSDRCLRPLSFLEGLKRTLNGQPVWTNTFGRVVIMSGLLSISWNQKMQDVRVNSTGVGELSSWGSQLLHAFDYWKQDFDVSLGTPNSVYLRSWDYPHSIDDGNVFESRTVLHCLAHMAMNVDIIDTQIFAGAKSLLGREISAEEHAAAVKRMKESWAPSARARDATFYALRFLSAVLRIEDNTSMNFLYSARDDNLLNRPWVLFFATLVVWSYGFALDGPIAPPTYTLSTRENKFHDMQGFLRRVGGVNSPEDLQDVKHRNSCLGLLMLLRDMFRTARWELLHESADLLCNCIDMLMPGVSQ